ncbi:MAG: Hsp20/alpha crystallin family protein [Pseudomonadales bacterium]
MAKDKDVAVRQSGEGSPQRLDQQVERVFEDFFNRRWLRPWMDWSLAESPLSTRAPRVDVMDRDSEVVVRAEMPGMSKDDIDISVSDNTVTLKGSTRKEEEKDEGDYHRREIVSSYVSRTVPLPCDVNGDQAKARLKEGMLEITLPKAEKAKRKRIEVES